MLTFEMIRDLERTERQSKKMQKLPEDIFVQIGDYIKRKEIITEKKSSDIMELESIKSTINRLFELRESKILSAVSDTVRTGIPPESMTKEEEQVFYKLVEMLKSHREQFFENLSKGKIEEKDMYKIKKDRPAFIGPDMKSYEFKENQVVHVPAPLRELLLKEELIEKVSVK